MQNSLTGEMIAAWPAQCVYTPSNDAYSVSIFGRLTVAIALSCALLLCLQDHALAEHWVGKGRSARGSCRRQLVLPRAAFLSPTQGSESALPAIPLSRSRSRSIPPRFPSNP